MLHAIRAIFILLSGVIGWWIGHEYYKSPWIGAWVGSGLSLAVVLLELAFTRRFIAVISVLMFGILIGFVFAQFLLAAFYMIPAIEVAVRGDPPQPHQAFYFEAAITFFCTLVSVIAILHTKDDLKFVIPFVELRREGSVSKPLILDTSAIIDGRIADILETRVIDTAIIIPRFVLQELQKVADSQDKLKRTRGRRGLDILNRLRNTRAVDVQVQEAEIPGSEGVDAKLVRLGKMADARIVTTDFNLNKVAQVQGVEVLNVNDLASALRPPHLQGEQLTIRVIRKGESPGQGVGYLDDGTMVVGEGCADRIGQEVELTVTNVLQTSAGRLIFGRPA